jgi:hypothetical protein
MKRHFFNKDVLRIFFQDPLCVLLEHKTKKAQEYVHNVFRFLLAFCAGV